MVRRACRHRSRGGGSVVDVDAAHHTVCCRLRWLIESNRKRGVAVRASTVGWGRGVSAVVRGVQLAALRSFLVTSDQLRYRTACEIPSADLSQPAAEPLATLLWAN